jgi:hypothetical protein
VLSHRIPANVDSTSSINCCRVRQVTIQKVIYVNQTCTNYFRIVEMLNMTLDASAYRYINQGGVYVVDSIDDDQEMQHTSVCQA